jgi:hypothetical protein
MPKGPASGLGSGIAMTKAVDGTLRNMDLD